MLDYLISLLDFTIGGTTYNLITTPWEKMLAWIQQYQQYHDNQYSTAIRDAYTELGKLGFMQACYSFGCSCHMAFLQDCARLYRMDAV